MSERSRQAYDDPFPEPLSGPFPERPQVRAKKHRRTRWVLTALLVVLLLAGGTGTYAYKQLNGNLRSAPLNSGTGVKTVKEKPDPFGRLPIDILVIGSDTRSKKEDCKLGGDCGNGNSGTNADVDMVVHVSADRSNITVMSVPRDTMANLPGCVDKANHRQTGPRYAQINSSLTWGPGCTVAAVQALTGIPIDHFVMVDFAGVISMSDSVGGVPICVSDNVYDPYSHLKLTKGKHVLKGLAALEFVRSRHAFGDGSDLGRTYSQHAFLSSMVRVLKRKGVLLNPTSLYSLASAATKALTVDPKLDSIPRLLDLAKDVNKVPADRITFTTMQTTPDPQNVDRVIVAPGASELFATIINDQSLTTATGAAVTPAPAATAVASPSAPAAALGKIVVQVRNGSGRSGRASAIQAALVAKGFSRRSTVGSVPTVATSSLSYGPGLKAQAQTLARELKLPASMVKPGDIAGLTLVIGGDWPKGRRYPGGQAVEKARKKAALNQAHALNATTSSCVEVSHENTVTVNGIQMTPVQAFSASPTIKESAR